MTRRDFIDDESVGWFLHDEMDFENSPVKGVRSDVAGLKSDVAELKSDVASLQLLRPQLAAVREDVRALREDMGVVRRRVELLKVAVIDNAREIKQRRKVR